MANQVARDNQGVDRCRRVVKTVVPVDKMNPAAGFRQVEAYCNKPVTFSVTENRRMCPECDKQPPVGNIHPKVTNAAGVVLTAKELRECGLSEDPASKEQPRKVRKPREAKEPVEGKVKKEAKKDSVSFEVPLSILEENGDIAAVLIKQAISAMDQLPTPTLAESKRLIKLQERLQALLSA